MKRLLIDKTPYDTRIALMENGRLAELKVFGSGEKIAGNIYAGRVMSVLPGMSLAFMDIGRELKGMYFFGDGRKPKSGDEFPVQAVKEEKGKKGAVLTGKLMFPGKFIIIIPNSSDLGISKRITEESERRRLAELTKSFLPPEYGAILRTEAEGKPEDVILDEGRALCEAVSEVMKKAPYMKAPALLWGGEPVARAVQELFTGDVDEFLINEPALYEEMLEREGGDERIRLYTGMIPIMEEYFAESQIEKAARPKIWLKSGGFIVIEETEAMVVIDVNTGKFTGCRDVKKTFLKTNMEAAEEIARQIRLRNLSGIIIVDFIDMRDKAMEAELTAFMAEELRRDRQKTVLLGMTELGLMQITRKREGDSLSAALSQPCRCCGGSGRADARGYLLGKIHREITAVSNRTIYDKVTLSAGERLLKAFAGPDNVNLAAYEKSGRKITLKKAENVPDDWYTVEGEKSRNQTQ